jgi:hypothetical protein
MYRVSLKHQCTQQNEGETETATHGLLSHLRVTHVRCKKSMLFLSKNDETLDRVVLTFCLQNNGILNCYPVVHLQLYQKLSQ